MVNAKLTAIVAALAVLPLLTPSLGRAQDTVLYDFWSPTCGPCRSMEPTVGRLISAGFPVQKINIVGTTEERAIASRFAVQRVPCFVMLAGGREIDRVVGSTSYSRLEQMVRRAVSAAEPARMPVARAQSPDNLPMDSPWTRHELGARATQPHSRSWPPTAEPSLEATDFVPAGRDGRPARGSSVYGPMHLRGGPSTAADPADRDLFESSVRLRVQDATGHSWGTGTIIDSRSGEALVVTCGHLFRESERDPSNRGTIVVELYQWTPGGPQVVAQVPGEVINYDLDRDIGLISIRPTHPVKVASVASDLAAIQVNLPVRSIGCDHGAHPTVRPSHVTAINRYLGAPNIEVAGAPVQGRSGGGLFNELGELIGICNAADDEDNEGLYAGLASLHQLLDQLGLSDVYQPGGATAIASAAGPATQGTAAAERESAVVRGQDSMALEPPFESSAPPIAWPGDTPARPSAATGGNHLSEVEQATWEEIIDRAEQADVVCIVQPSQPGGQAEVIRLNSVSAEFMRRLLSAAEATTGAAVAASPSATAPPPQRPMDAAPLETAANAPSPWGAAR